MGIQIGGSIVFFLYGAGYIALRKQKENRLELHFGRGNLCRGNTQRIAAGGVDLARQKRHINAAALQRLRRCLGGGAEGDVDLSHRAAPLRERVDQQRRQLLL